MWTGIYILFVKYYNFSFPQKKEMNILYIPLDERPCNYKYPKLILEDIDNINLICPPQNYLNEKKKSGRVDKIWDFVYRNIEICDYAILSMDMLIYGGLLPSRLHQLSEKTLIQRLSNIKRLKYLNGNLKIYAFDTIMRVPSYNSSEEEPDYYNEYGKDIFTISWLSEKIEKNIASEDEIIEYNNLVKNVPIEYRHDYFTRRRKNSKITEEVIKLVKNKIIDFLVIPQDDSALYGIQSKEQKEHIKTIKNLDIEEKVFIYPGADEVGCTLLSRAINDYNSRKPGVYIRFSSTNGATIIPKYEDRQYFETIKWHLIASGLWMVDNSIEADIVLMVNTPGQEMQEAATQDTEYRENNTMRNLMEFCIAAKEYIKKNKKVIIADVAYSNGSDKELIKLLGKTGILNNLSGYSGWNTNGNSLGTVLCTGVCSLYHGDNLKFLIHRYIEDCGYQAIARQIVVSELEKENLSYYDFKDKESWVKERVMVYLQLFIKENLEPFFENNIGIKKINFPWKRMFEIDIDILI